MASKNREPYRPRDLLALAPKDRRSNLVTPTNQAVIKIGPLKEPHIPKTRNFIRLSYWQGHLRFSFCSTARHISLKPAGLRVEFCLLRNPRVSYILSSILKVISVLPQLEAFAV